MLEYELKANSGNNRYQLCSVAFPPTLIADLLYCLQEWLRVDKVKLVKERRFLRQPAKTRIEIKEQGRRQRTRNAAVQEERATKGLRC